MTAVCHQGMKAVVKNSLMLSSQGDPENSSAGLVTHCRQCCGKWLLHGWGLRFRVEVSGFGFRGWIGSPTTP